MKIIDLTCKGCGASMDFEEPNEKFQIEFNKKSNTVVFFNQDDIRIKLVCPYCKNKQMGWLAGEETIRANGLTMNTVIEGNGNSVIGIHIGGNVVGSNINIGNNKIS